MGMAFPDGSKQGCDAMLVCGLWEEEEARINRGINTALDSKVEETVLLPFISTPNAYYEVFIFNTS